MHNPPTFDEFDLHADIIKSVKDLGYTTPTPVQSESIGILLKGYDLLAQAKTGTGKTAAFALPILSTIDIKQKSPQALVIVPTRELAMQVAEAFRKYAQYLKNFRVVAIYGGQSYQTQIEAIKKGVQVIVSTPGRIIDHLRKKTVTLDSINTVVLDEADEMLKMGFIEDIDLILEKVPKDRRTALFSATIPDPIKKICSKYLNKPKKVTIKDSKKSVDTIDQYFIKITRDKKLDLLTRVLEVEAANATIIFVRTKQISADVAEKLQARGYRVSALNGDLNQSFREKVIAQLKKGALDIVVATDVAARGIDVKRISHVINYDIPDNTETYIHRVGRTGRAGNTGKSIAFITNRENRLLRDIEYAVGKPVKPMEIPTIAEIKQARAIRLSETVVNILEKSRNLEPNYNIIKEIASKSDFNANDIAAALLHLLNQNNPVPTHELTAGSSKSGDGRSSARSRDNSRYRDGKPRTRDGKPRSGRGKPGSRDGKPGSRNSKSGSRDGKPGSRSSKPDSRNSKPGTRDDKSRKRSDKSGARDSKTRTGSDKSRSRVKIKLNKDAKSGSKSSAARKSFAGKKTKGKK